MPWGQKNAQVPPLNKCRIREEFLNEGVGSRGLSVASGELLVNLTPHDVGLAVQASGGLPERAGEVLLVRVPRSGDFARVDDDAAAIGSELLATRSGVFRLTHLRREESLIDLPAARPGTRYLVSRLTALAAHDRADLVFPLGEIRDGDGQIAGALGLGSFTPDRGCCEVSPERRLVAARLAGRSVDRQWLVSVLFAAATLFLGAAAGTLPGALDEARGSHGSLSTWSTWLTAGFGVAGIVLLVIATWRWVRAGRIRRLRGTAYVIIEETPDWRLENKAAVLAEVKAGFDEMLEVLGPSGLGFDWNWGTDERTAPQWDRRADELVNSFLAVQRNDDLSTPNAVFIWAPWPVAMALGARTSARERNMALHVRQRPSNASVRTRPKLTDTAHDFRGTEHVPSLESMAPALAADRSDGKITVTVRPLGTPERLHRKHGRSDSRRDTVRDNPHSLLLLVVRITHGPVGPIGMDLGKTDPFDLEVAPSLTKYLPSSGPQQIPAAEWRLVRRDAEAGKAPAAELPWTAFPSATAEIAEWLADQAAAHHAKVVLLATRMPQELGVGLGIQLRQRSWDLTTGHRWPEHVYPAVHAGDNRRLIVPDLRLGADSVPSRRV